MKEQKENNTLTLISLIISLGMLGYGLSLIF